MKLTIIVTSYNVEKYITECLLSILRQLTSECELIVVDDCSTDASVRKIKALVEPYGSKVWFYQNMENRGVSAARNLGLHYAMGDYVAFIDGDDMVASYYIQNILMALCSHKDIYRIGWKAMNSKATYEAKKLPDWNCSVWSRLYKRDLLKIPFVEGLNWGEDWRFLHDNQETLRSKGYIGGIIYFYRDNREGSLTQLHTLPE